MADLKITALPALVEAGVQAVDVLALADLSATETKKVTVKDLVAAGVALIDDADIPAAKVGTLTTNQVATGAIQDGAVTNVKLANSSVSLGGVSISLGQNDGTPAFLLTDATGYLTTNLVGTITNAQLAGSIAGTKVLDTTITYAKLNLSDGDVPGAKIATGGITATQLAANSVTASELADDAVDTAAIADGAVVAASIAADTITDAQIATDAITATELADNAVNAGAIQSNAVTTAKILDANVTAAKLAANLPGTILATGAIGSTQLAADSVTASELADNAVDSGAIAASAVTDAKIASGIGGAKITDGTITAAKLATANIDRSLNVASGNLGINNTVVAATRSGITYNAQGLITATVALAASDLPLATTSAVGAVSVGTGLAVTGAGALSLSNSVTAATISGITYNAQGQITATTALVAGDLPAATTSAKGAVQVTSGGGISIDGSGAISTSTSGITAGTYAKVTVNNKGVATAGASLVAGDIPSLAATKITSGTFDVGRFGTNTILGSKFADSSVCQFTGAQSTSGVVTFPTAEFKGQFFYDLTNDDLYVYDGSAFQPVTITSGEIIYAGNYRADTNKITSLTAAGTAQGFTQNAALQAASAANNRYYFVCDKSGTGTSPAPTVTINPPDMILSNGATWEKLDISNFIAGQVASNIGVTATGGIQNTNVQSVLEELDTEKLNLTGGTLTGNLALNQSSSIIFEGSTPDDFETTLTVIDPTADRTVSLPNVTGTLVSSGDTGTVTSTMILDGTILNADINASAAIALTKLANVTAAHIIVGNASNVPTAVAVTGDISISNAGLVAITADSIVNADIKSDAAIAGSKIVAGTTSVVGVVQLTDSAASSSTTTAATPAAVKVAKDAADAAATTANAALATTGGTLTNNLIIDNAKQIRFTEADANGANFVSLQAPDTLAADVSYTLPSAAPTANGQVLAGTTAGVLSWTDDPTGQWVTNGTNVYYDGGNVGIGVGNSPSEKLEVEGTAQVLSELRSKTGHDLKLNAGSANRDVFLQVNDSTLMTVQGSTGNVGIGVSPTSSLHVSVGSSGTNSSAGFNEFCIEGADEDIGMCFLSPAANERTHTIAFGDSNNNNAGKIQYNHSTDDLTITASDNIILTGDAVGIGTTSPTGIHNLAKVLEISGGDGGDLIIGNNASSNVGAGAHIGAIAFKNIDTAGSPPHYAGIRCEAIDQSGNMDLRFYTGNGNLEADTPQVILTGNSYFAYNSNGYYAKQENYDNNGGKSYWYDGASGNNNIVTSVDGETGTIYTSSQIKIARASAYASSDADELIVGNEATNANQGITILSHTSKSGTIYFGDGDNPNGHSRGQFRYDHGEDAFIFATAGGSEDIRISSTGRLLVGTTDNSGYGNRSAYFVNQNDDWNYISITGATDGGAGIVFGDSTGQSAANYETYMAHSNIDNHFTIYTNQGNQRFTFDDNGHLGLGPNNTSPSAAIHINDAGQQNLIIGSTNAGGAYLVLDGDSDGDSSGGDYAFIGHDTNGDLILAVDNPAGTGSIFLKSNQGTYQAVSCRAAGDVELRYQNSTRLATSSGGGQLTGGWIAESNAASSTTPLTVRNNTGDAASDCRLSVRTYSNYGGDPYIHLDSGGTNFIVGQRWMGTTNNYMVLGPGESPSGGVTGGIYIQGNGKVGINTSGGSYRMNIVDTSTSPVWTYTNSAGYYNFIAQSNTNTGTQYYFSARRLDGSQDGYLVSSTDGVINLANGSDYRLKDNVASMTNGIDIIKKLNPITYKWKASTGRDTSVTIQGFLAHEVDEAGVLNAVDGVKDGVWETAENPMEAAVGDPRYQGLSLERLVPALTAALKEAIVKIETLETKVAALEAS